jgi:predicted secreted protein
MSASPAVSAFGTLVKIGDGAVSESFTTIAELRKIGGPKLKLETIDVTVHNTTEPWRQFIGGLLDGGEVTVDLNFIPSDSTHNPTTGLLADMINRVQRNFQMVFPDAGLTTWAFTALVIGFDMSSEPSSVLMATVTLKISGSPTLS